jgi:hypothetical protein
MKKIIYNLLLLFVTVVALSSCEKEEENFRVTPPTQIIFDENINKITGSYGASGNITLKISAPGATSVTVRTGTRTLATLPVAADGVANLNIPSTSVRPAGSAPSTIPGSYSFRVDATMPDGSIATRFYTVVVTA